MAAGGGVEHIGLEHGVVGDTPAASIPWLSSTLRSYFEVLPHLRRVGSSSSGLSLPSTPASVSCTGAPDSRGRRARRPTCSGSMAKGPPTTRASIVETGGLGVEQTAAPPATVPATHQFGLIQDAAIVGFDGGCRGGAFINFGFALLSAAGPSSFDQVAQLILRDRPPAEPLCRWGQAAALPDSAPAPRRS